MSFDILTFLGEPHDWPIPYFYDENDKYLSGSVSYDTGEEEIITIGSEEITNENTINNSIENQ